MKKVVMMLILLVFLVGCSQVQEIRQKEIDRITEEKTQKITDSILGVTSEKKIECNIPKTKRQFNSEKYYTGPLIDSHVHMPVASKIVSSVAIKSGFEDMPAYDDKLSIDYIVCLFESEGVKKVFGFNVAPNIVSGQSINKVKSNEKRYPGKFVNFYMPTQLPGLNPSAEKVKRILSDNPGLFKGYGEVKFSFSEIENQGIHDSEYLTAYQLADDNNLVIMMHPGFEHEEEVIFLLKKHPNVNFLFHSGESGAWIDEVLEKFDNAYFTFEPTHYLFGWSEGHGNQGPSKREFLDYMKANFDSSLSTEVANLKPRIEKYPNKFLWGTDRWYRWHFDQEVGAVVEEFSRSFIGQLNENVQEKFAYKNAEKIVR
jgi:predicted TIM-barrel fold metal-dependent hydrolase